jgi:polysaccharide export outer membrane protein
MPCRTQPRACGPGGVSRLALFTVAIGCLLGVPASSAAQNPPLPPPSQAQSALQQAIMQNPGLADSVRRRLEASGLTPEQIRARLAAAGYPAGLFDAYLGPTQPGQAGPQPGALELTAIQALGLGPAPVRAESIHVDTGMIRVRAESLHAESLAVGNYVFGVDVFRRTTNQFLPLLAGPVPPDYRLGPGDQLVLILTGEVELSYTLPVTREGFILIPHVGQIYVVNLTLGELRDVLYTRLGRVYAGVTRRADAKIRFDVSVANVRVNQVYVAGEVKQPGAYQISALGTALTALYAAGGVTTRASLRDIAIRRGDKTIAQLDLYDYLLRGDKHDDVRLETGDVVFVPLHSRRTQIVGAVLRPAIYELKSGETLPDLLRAAGGFRQDAALQHVTVHRILPAPVRGTGPFPRAVVDVPLPVASAETRDPPGAAPDERIGGVFVPALPLEGGDSIVVDSVAPLDSSYFVAIAGAVNKPGRFPWREGMTLRDLVRVAGGPKVEAYVKEAEIARMPSDRSKGQLAQTVRVPLDSTYLTGRDTIGRYVGPPGPAVAGSGAPEVALQPFDNVLILRQPDFSLPRTVYVTGQVRYPGTYTLTTGNERLGDVIARAGGLTPLAYAGGVRFVRSLGNVGRINVDLPRALKDRDSRSNIILQSGDSIAVPEYKPSVQVVGAVNAPGSVLWERGKDLNYYLNAAGGPSWRADKGKVSVRYANGEVQTRHRTLIFRSDPTPDPGSEVLVPVRDTTVRGTDALAVVGALAQLITATATVIIVSKR